MKVTSLTLFTGIAAMFMAACSKPVESTKPVDLENLKTEIQKMEDAYSAGEKAKDADAVVAYYSEDAVSHVRNREPVNGKAAIKDRIADRLAKDTTGNTNVYKVVDLFAEGDMAVEIGSCTEMNPAGEVVYNGHYMSYFEKRDGKYLCVRDMSISNMPEKKE
jgi:ketosteroid isomerase-like protein